MSNTVKAFCILAMLVLTAGSIAKPVAASADDYGSDKHASLVIVFKDGHRQTFASADIARIDFTAPAMIVFKDGHRPSIPAAEVERIEFETASAFAPNRSHFVGKWQVGDGNGSNFYITLERDGEATKSHGPPHGTWILVDGEARISWDDGWHDVIRKVGSKHEKLAFEPGKSFDAPPSNVTVAKTTEPRPI